MIRANRNSSKSASGKPIENVFTGSARLVGHGGDDCARVDSAREESAERDLADQADAGGLPDQLAKALGRAPPVSPGASASA